MSSTGRVQARAPSRKRMMIRNINIAGEHNVGVSLITHGRLNALHTLERLSSGWMSLSSKRTCTHSVSCVFFFLSLFYSKNEYALMTGSFLSVFRIIKSPIHVCAILFFLFLYFFFFFLSLLYCC